MLTEASYDICKRVLSMDEDQLRKFTSGLSKDNLEYLQIILNKLTDEELQTILRER